VLAMACTGGGRFLALWEELPTELRVEQVSF